MIKSELDFGLDNFGKQKILSQSETIAQLILNILLMRPGQMPSMPHIGIDIRKYLYKFEEDIDSEALKKEINYQCSLLIPYLDLTGLRLMVVDYHGEGVLMLIIPLSISSQNETLLIGFKKDSNSGEIVFNYQFEDKLK